MAVQAANHWVNIFFTNLSTGCPKSHIYTNILAVQKRANSKEKNVFETVALYVNYLKFPPSSTFSSFDIV